MHFSSKTLERLGAGDDLNQLLGDHLAGVAGGIIHGAHLRAIERGGVLAQRPEYLHRDIARQQLRENLLLVGLVLIAYAARAERSALRAARRARLERGLEDRRNDLLRSRDLRDHGLEARKEQGANVEGAIGKEAQDTVGDLFGICEVDGAHRAQLDMLDDHALILALELLVALTADAEEFDLLALRDERVGA